MKERLVSHLVAVLLVFGLIMVARGAEPSPRPASADAAMVTVTPREFTGGIQNPLKGFRPDSGAGKPFCSVFRRYLKWNELEKCEGDSLERILYATTRACEEKGKSYAEFNAKLVPRVYLYWPPSGSARGKLNLEYWPEDLQPYDYESPAFNRRAIALIEKLGRAWDEDPRIYAVEMGLIGYWGEQHHPHITAEQRRLFTDAFRKAFKHKPVLVRTPYPEFAEAGFGIYNDCFATLEREPETPKAMLEVPMLSTTRYPDLWKRAPVEGEVQYRWQTERPAAKPEETFGRTPDETMSDPKYRQYMIGKIRRYHVSYLGWIAGFDARKPEVLAGAGEIQKAFGYRFVLERFSFTPRVAPDGSLAIRFAVSNTGSAPFYLDWPVAVALLDARTHKPVWQTELKNADIRQWLPGDKWDEKTSAYEIPARSYEVSERVAVPASVATGEYLVALGILDRQGGLTPSVRFACVNYVTGGWHPLGVVGVGCSPARTEPEAVMFVSPAFDETLGYRVPARLRVEQEPPVPAFTPVKAWAMDLSREILNPYHFWDIGIQKMTVERRVTFDGPVPGEAGAKVVTAFGEFDGSSFYCELAATDAKLPPGRYQLDFQCKGTEGLRLQCALADGGKAKADSPVFKVTPTWQSHRFIYEITGEFKEGAGLRFQLPASGSGEFSVTDYHLRKLD